MGTTRAGRAVRAAGGAAVLTAALVLAWDAPGAAAPAGSDARLSLHGETASPTPTPEHEHEHEHEGEGTGHDHGTVPVEPTDHDSHGGEPDTVSGSTKAVVVSGFGLVNAAVVGTALVLRRRERRAGGPVRGPRNVRAARAGKHAG